MTLNFTLTGSEPERLNLPDAELVWYPRPGLDRRPEEWFDLLQRSLAWREESIQLFGKRYRQPRLLAWYGDAGASYRYSGVLHEPLPWLPELEGLRRRVEHLTGARFNSMLANLYRHERDSMGLHADDEPELGPRPVIASLSFGQTRTFRLRHRQRGDLKPVRLPLTSGSLLVMRGDTQRYWKHEVPKERSPCGPRINLTFRRVERAMRRAGSPRIGGAGDLR